MTLIQPWPPSLMRPTGPVWGATFGRRGCSLLVAALGCTARDPSRVGCRGLARPNRAGPRPGPEPRGLFLWATRIVLN